MRFGPVPLREAEGAILAHSLDLPQRRLRKGRRLERADLDELRAAGLEEVVAARLDPDDLHEDAAATRVAQALVPDPAAACIRLTQAATGRVNLYATAPGVVRLAAEAIAGLNQVDSMITFACPQPFAQTREGGLVGTVKIISYGVAAAAVERAAHIGRGAIAVLPTRLRSADLILTALSPDPQAPPRPPTDRTEQKARDVLAARLQALGMELAGVTVVPHRAQAIAAALAACRSDLVLILTVSATSDAHDVAPEALRRAGGRVTRFGMPVDPGNLLFLGDLQDRPVIGLPGCARSPALNGADFVLSRVAAGVRVEDADIAAMGIGGLLKEIPVRGRLREG